MAKERFRISPDLCTYVNENENTLNIEVSLPGTKKENIRLRMLEDSFSLSAPGRDVEYVSASAFCCPVNPDRARAVYEDGCLKVTVPFKDPFENAVEVAIG